MVWLLTDSISLPKIDNGSAKANHHYKDKIISGLPRDERWLSIFDCYQYQGFWYYPGHLEGVMSAQEHFVANPTDVIISNAPKTGSTWIKALTFAIATRSKYNSSNSPLLTSLPHYCMPALEVISSLKFPITQSLEIPLFATHIPYDSLPKSVLSSRCKIIYICREPKDVLVSLWYHMKRHARKDKASLSLQEAFELFCEGVSVFGPYWDHILGYWKASMESPQRILFLKYEDLKKDAHFYVQKIADFMGYPFSLNEEKKGAVQEIVDLCSFENLSNLEVNKTGKHHVSGSNIVDNSAFFRKGEVGDWKNHLTPEMAERIDKITEQKLGRFGLEFDTAAKK
ncbi:Sulfotransferase domain [Dillenia turbinata]|uniref:Sulfotransferase n=1 Tax=Dillenia turbinata TaxID=194707 RepID=A0AAN8VD07_9MAGN